ncbi:hypothetical protein BDK51DRAFT_49214 [Blyttiomyces helicus]|uniref:Uncharacterized protein n=1 Tax=Blyttiomyces helicus TaxID=388810 RepID=A0A4P9VZN4_9FUNG|nr:hypothetical protein BDK51DRAFT_49214 [Blyttiomyces helicus]|eukprot:RKO84802.1 hypothetical protein BDK51DRAFT_49214 [Blyttiomyces helicus]
MEQSNILGLTEAGKALPDDVLQSLPTLPKFLAELESLQKPPLQISDCTGHDTKQFLGLDTSRVQKNFDGWVLPEDAKKYVPSPWLREGLRSINTHWDRTSDAATRTPINQILLDVLVQLAPLKLTNSLDVGLTWDGEPRKLSCKAEYVIGERPQSN